jgi:hypothetical protein
VQVDLEEYHLVTASTNSSAAGPANAQAIIENCILAKECRPAFGRRENFENKKQNTKFENIPAEPQSGFAPHVPLFLPELRSEKRGAMTRRNAHKEVA